MKVNSVATQEALGSTAKSPRWAIAVKFKARQATTKLEDIRIQVGRTGALDSGGRSGTGATWAAPRFAMRRCITKTKSNVWAFKSTIASFWSAEAMSFQRL